MARRGARPGGNRPRGANPLWTYSLRLYKRPGVAPACIALQDRLGVDVNLLFFCLWMAASGRRLTPATLRLAAGLARVWTTNVVGPLRGTRRFLKPLGLPKLRGAVAQVELAAERAEQDLLIRLAPPSRRPAVDAAQHAMENVARYSAYWRKRPRPADRRDLLRILRAAFPAG
ncbi:MAG TPA: TIGR02444 family protein [Alphaproteobacteria bacterium]|nr:TIGR02444 family protein [Alphaproteobacteria bacterium]